MRGLLRASFVFLAVIPHSVFSGGCGALTGQPFRYDPGAPGPIIGLRAEPGVGLVTLSWSPISVATSYNIYYVSALTYDQVTKENGTAITVTSSSYVVSGLDNNVPYHFMVTGHNDYHGEGPESLQVTATPGPATKADLVGAWYFHTLITGEGAGWQRGVATVGDRCKTVDEPCSTTVSELEVSGSSSAGAPQGFGLSVEGDGTVLQSGVEAWTAFHGTIGSRKNMIVATWAPSAASKAMTIFQKMKEATEPEYTISDISGTGKAGNGPTLFTYHQLSSGSSSEWEYSNCKIGQEGQFWRKDLRDITYWDYSTPTYKVAPKYDYLWKETSVGIDLDGLFHEYLNEGTHDVVFTGRMTADRTVVVGVSTRKDAQGNDTQHFLRIMELCFRPADQALPAYTLNDLAGTYKFHKLSASGWARGALTITSTGEATFSEYADSVGDAYSLDGFSLYYYPDNGDTPYSAFANFTTPAQRGAPHYCDASGKPFHSYYDYWSYGRTGTPLEMPMSDDYYNEHGTLSYNKDLFVLTRTDAAGDSIIVALR